MKLLDRAKIVANHFLSQDVEQAIILEDIRYSIDEGKSWEQVAKELSTTVYWQAQCVINGTYNTHAMMRKVYFDELAKLRPDLNNYKYNKKRGKVLLNIDKTAFVVTNCSRTYQFDCCNCSTRLMGDYVARRVGARIEGRYCHLCFDILLKKLKGDA